MDIYTLKTNKNDNEKTWMDTWAMNIPLRGSLLYFMTNMIASPVAAMLMITTGKMTSEEEKDALTR